ncbi:hypothetical protein QJS10_CPA06g02519 [Acorus calamus]|uniref:Myb-like domain-containing protein n=1 Tax=Acorus calamus TaxID=4465 RepID=A0AAV9EHU8_ACOCL|nr:hypothetical protein QJS10_CPA06g02519 [Acorus calamus]
MKRKKWSDEEEETLISAYSDLLRSGSLSRLKTREKKFQPIADRVNSAHHDRTPSAFPFRWSWRDVSVKVQNMRHRYLSVKLKIRRPSTTTADGDFAWDDGVDHWPNFLKYKHVFGDVDLVPSSAPVDDNDEESQEDPTPADPDPAAVVEVDDFGCLGFVDCDGSVGAAAGEVAEEGGGGGKVGFVLSKVLEALEDRLEREERRREREERRREREERERRERREKARAEREREEEEWRRRRWRRREEEGRREAEEMEWRERLMEMQMEHEKRMVQMQAEAMQGTVQMVGAVLRFVGQVLGSGGGGGGGEVGVGPVGSGAHHVLQELQQQQLHHHHHHQRIGDGKPNGDSDSQYM